MTTTEEDQLDLFGNTFVAQNEPPERTDGWEGEDNSTDIAEAEIVDEDGETASDVGSGGGGEVSAHKKLRGALALTPEEIDRIIALKLRGVGVRDIVATTGHGSNTITKTWRKYLEERRTERNRDLELTHLDAVERLLALADQIHAAGEVAMQENKAVMAAKIWKDEAQIRLQIENLTRYTPMQTATAITSGETS